jgi:DNA polymerase-3 subunit epsilon
MLLLAYDTETTGIARGHDYTNPDNPHLAALTGILFDNEVNRIVSSINVMIEPTNWLMPPEAGAVNGLTTETLSTLGIPLEAALVPFLRLADSADLLIAHNCAFDQKIISAAIYRNYWKSDEDLAHNLVLLWQQKKQYCTMEASKPIVQAKNKRGALKYPKLSEAYEFFFNRPLDNAHSANADTIAVLEIYTALQSHGEVSL